MDFEGPKLLNKSNNKSRIFSLIRFCIPLDSDSNWGHLREIPGTKMLVSLYNCYDKYAMLEIFDLQNEGRAPKIHSFDRVFGSNN